MKGPSPPADDANGSLSNASSAPIQARGEGTMQSADLRDLVEKLRARVSSMERTIKDAETASERSSHTQKSLDDLRQSLDTAKRQLAQVEQRIKPSA